MITLPNDCEPIRRAIVRYYDYEGYWNDHNSNHGMTLTRISLLEAVTRAGNRITLRAEYTSAENYDGSLNQYSSKFTLTKRAGRFEVTDMFD